MARYGSRGSGFSGSTLASVEGGRSSTTAASAAGSRPPSAVVSRARGLYEFGGASEGRRIASSMAASSTMATRLQSRVGSQAPGSLAFNVPSRYESMAPSRAPIGASARAPPGPPTSSWQRPTLSK